MIFIDRFLKGDILELLEHFPVIGILGSRQSGKTTLAKDIIKGNPKGFLYLDLELPSDLEKLAKPEFYLNRYKNMFKFCFRSRKCSVWGSHEAKFLMHSSAMV